MKKNNVRIFKLALVNVFTITRLLGAIALPFVYIIKGIDLCSIWTLILYLTDAIDGFLARRFKVSTFFGSAIDGLSDKLLNTVSFILLSLTYNIMLFPLLIEIFILIVLYNTYRQGGNIKSSIIGKIKTIVLDFCVISSFTLLGLPQLKSSEIIILILIENTNYYMFILGIITSIFGFITLVDYIIKNIITRKNPNRILIKELPKNRKTFNELINDAFSTKYYLEHRNEPIMRQFYKT